MSDAAFSSLTTLIQAGESLRCEWKSDLSSKDNKEKICRTICAFANDIANTRALGYLALGIDKNGRPTGLAITDELELQIQNIRGEGKITPLPSFSTRRFEYQGQTILLIEVNPAISPPVKYEGRIWVRPGNATQLASLEDERRLNEKRRAFDQPDDCQVLAHCRIEDLDLAYFKASYLPQAIARDVLEANGRTIEEQLASSKMIGSVTDPHPTVLGLLCLGLSPADNVPGAYVQFLRVAGTDLDSPVLDEAQIHGHVADLIRQTEAKFAAHNQTPVDFISQATEQRAPYYPKVAFEQLFRNAVMHRAYLGTHSPIRIYWYQDRLEITSPGGPYGMVTEQNFGQPHMTDYRNPNLAAALRDLGYVQRFGAGIANARQALLNNGNPPLEHQCGPGFVTFTMRQRSS
jgi:ATP-dependent DNA helicase RecG